MLIGKKKRVSLESFVMCIPGLDRVPCCDFVTVTGLVNVTGLNATRPSRAATVTLICTLGKALTRVELVATRIASLFACPPDFHAPAVIPRALRVRIKRPATKRVAAHTRDRRRAFPPDCKKKSVSRVYRDVWTNSQRE